MIPTVDVLEKIVKEAGNILLSHAEKRTIVTTKEHRDILAQADLDSDSFLTVQLQKTYPSVRILSEETQSRVNKIAGERFIIDPLDGTINFTRGIGEYGISLAYEKAGVVEIGIVYKPHSNEWFIGVKGKGSTYNGRNLRVSNIKNLEEAVVAVDFARNKGSVPQYLDNLHRNVRVLRSYGCAVHILGLVAQGSVDAYLYETPKIWDIAAMQCIIGEAGGVFLKQNGEPWKEGESLVVTTPALASALLVCIKADKNE